MTEATAPKRRGRPPKTKPSVAAALQALGLSPEEADAVLSGKGVPPVAAAKVAARRAPAPVEATPEAFDESELQEIKTNYRRVRNNLRPIGADGTRPDASERPSPEEVDYWTKQAIAAGFAAADGKPPHFFRQAPDPMDAVEPAPVVQKAAPARAPPAAPPKEVPPDPRLVAGLGDALAVAIRRWGAAAALRVKGDVAQVLDNGRVAAQGSTWEEAFEIAGAVLGDGAEAPALPVPEEAALPAAAVFQFAPPVAVAPVAVAPVAVAPVAVAPVAQAPAVEARPVDRLGSMASMVAKELGHKLSAWYRPDGEADNKMISACSICSAGVEVQLIPKDGGANIRGRSYTTVCSGA